MSSPHPRATAGTGEPLSNYQDLLEAVTHDVAGLFPDRDPLAYSVEAPRTVHQEIVVDRRESAVFTSPRGREFS